MKKNNILIVDDNIRNIEITGRILKEEGYLLSLAQDPESALELLKNKIPDLILLDVVMPKISGFELCRKIKQIEKYKDIPVIFLTVKDKTEDVVDGFKAGGVDFITKPFNREELLIRVRNHLELFESRKRIVEMNRTSAKMYSIIAHDISMPFLSITQTINAINKGRIKTEGEGFKEIIESLSRETLDTKALLYNLLEWTKVQSESISLSICQTNIYNILSECIQLLKGNAQNKNISLNIDMPENCYAYCDEVTVHTIFRNLISNAIKFTPKNGKVDLSSQENRKHLDIIVKDTGVGMPVNVIQTIFQKDEHYTSLGTNEEKGSGLGLRMVKDFVNKNNGKLNVKSFPEKGTEITVSLPITN